ncbi:MAG: hypothetical protein A3H35_03995 [Betaproteobacteria bacterium RIFCSPLOWO2_02_FULL_62_17]|nr:MAG: hypothetical protein A3H35_03995 [Betaproteobacteria bacterium RIFCSPLOWO2_02_FULL_62_17]
MSVPSQAAGALVGPALLGKRARGRASALGLTGRIVIGIGVAIAIYLIAAPLLMLLTAALRGPQDLLPFEPGAQWTLSNLSVYAEPGLWRTVIPNTLIFAAGAVSLTFVVAFTLAWLVERTDLPARNAVFTLVLFPLLVPGVVLAIAWSFLLAPNTGWVNLALRAMLGLQGSGPLNIFSMGGLIFAQGMAQVPFVFLLLTAALRSMNPALEEASSASGASPFTTFRKITLRVLAPGLLAPLILSALITLEQFEMPLLIGLPGRTMVFSTRIFYELNPDTDLPAYGRAAALALPFLLGGMVLLYLYNLAIRSADRFVTVTGKGFRPTRFKLGAWKWPGILLVLAYGLIAAILPAVVLLWASLFGYGADLPTLASIDFKSYKELFASSKFWIAVRNTFVVAGASAALVTVIGALVSWTVLRTRMRGRGVLDFISFISLGIPSVIAGLACLLLYASLPLGLYGTVMLLIVAYSYRLAVTTRLSRAALMQIHAELEEASYMSGGAWLTTLRRVVLPLLSPALLSSFLLLFIIGFREFTLPTILQSEDNVVISVIMWHFFASNRIPQAAAVGTLIIVFVAPVIFIMRRLLQRQDDAA